MTSPHVDHHELEDERVAVVERIGLLGTPRDAAFDEIVAHLAMSLDVPMASFSLVNKHHKWAKASFGFDRTLMNRDVAFCDRVVTDDEMLVIPDTHLAEPFRSNQHVVEEPYLRSYAGVPVHASGLPIGTLCVLDVAPRDFTSAHLDTLGFLARQIEHLVDLHARRRAEAPPHVDAVTLAANEIAMGAPFANAVAGFDRVAYLYDDETLSFVEVNDLAVERYGYSRDEFLSMSLLEIRPDNDEREVVEAIVRNAGKHVYAGDRSFNHLRSDGEIIDVKIVSVPTIYHGRPSHLVVVTDVTAQLFLHDAIKHAADSDGLTGLANRREFVRLLGTQLSVSPNDSIAVSFIDLDRFKLVNDSMGHETGDALLGAASARIREQTPTALLLARLGGDEFAVMNHVSDASMAFEQAQRIREALERPFQLKGYELMVSASIGVAISEPGSTAQGLLSQADAAMYAAKEAGRNGCVVFDQALRDRTAEWAQVQRDLGRAIDGGQFELHLQRIYQPGHESEGAIAYEALARWNHPERGLLAPGSFIGVAEESGLIVQLGSQLLKMGAAHAAALDSTVCVNVSVRQFNRALVDEVEHLIDLHRLRPGQLVIEITESAVVDAAYAQTVLHGLRRAGAQIWIDDFGTGFSSLARLSSLNVDGLKLDRMFVHDLDSERGWGIATAVTGIARALDIIVVAEGVETQRQLERVRELGCHAVQGYHLGHPGPAEVEIDRRSNASHQQLAVTHLR